MRRTLALLATTALLTACGTDSPKEQPAPAAPVTIAPATTAEPPSPTPSTLTKWVNVPCSPEGATAKTTSGGTIVCKKVGSDKQPVWHAATP